MSAQGPTDPEGPVAGAPTGGAADLALRLLGAVVVLAAAVAVGAYLWLPVDLGPRAPGRTMAGLSSLYVTLGMVLHGVAVAALGVAVVVRPRLGAGALAAAAVALPWTAAFAGGLADLSSAPAAMDVVLAAVAALVAAVAAALVLALVRLRPPGGGVVLGDAVAAFVGVTALWATVGTGWFRVRGFDPGQRFGDLLGAAGWSGRAAWLALVLAAAAVVVAVVGGGPARRVVGLVLAGVLLLEAARRTLLTSASLLGPGAAPFGSVRTETILPLVAVQLAGAAAGAWLATTEVGPAAPEDGERPAPAPGGPGPGAAGPASWATGAVDLPDGPPEDWPRA